MTREEQAKAVGLKAGARVVGIAVTDDDFIGPVIVAAPDEATAWSLLAGREVLKTLGWQIAQELAALRGRRSSIPATTGKPS